jgi:hypothetical protein
LALAVAAVLTLSGCSLAASITTNEPYDASDGVGTTVDNVIAQNLILVATAEGEPGVLLGSLTNNGSERAFVVITDAQTPGGEGESVTIRLDAGQTVRLGTADGEDLVTMPAPVAPGLFATFRVAVTRGQEESVYVPVVDGTLPEYAAVLESLPAE